jgi:RNA polymerase sigma-70 factor (ECF subfamily)
MSTVTESIAPGAATPAERTDDSLVAALRQRDEDAYLELVRRYTPLMLRVARSVVGQREAAEDVVQDTWVAVLRSVDGFEGRSTFKTWLMRILVNTARSRRLRDTRQVCWPCVPGDTAGWDGALAAESPDAPLESALAGEAWARIQAAFALLPERQRAVVVLRDVEGSTSDEVCGVLGVSLGNQRVLLHRGRARLRELLAVAPVGA